MAEFLELTAERRALAFEQAGTRQGLHPGIIEKDFWVCWLLRALFSNATLAPHIVFKGGTSLSKVFSVIDRFSEDIDVSVSPAFVGFDVAALEPSKSRRQRDAAVAAMERLCCINAETVIAPILEAAAAEALGTAPIGSWIEFQIDEQSHSPTLHLRYPATQTEGLEYISRAVKLELGSLTDQEPTRAGLVRPWIADEFPQLFHGWQCQVTALDISRSFWEKATILHAEYFRPTAKPTPDRYARHYADVARLLDHVDANAFLHDEQQCARVVAWKERFFARAWARYELARRGTFRLAPPEHRIDSLGNDYTIMEPMFLHEPATFAEILEKLREAEAVINRA